MKKMLFILAFVLLLGCAGALAESIAIDEKHFPDAAFRGYVADQLDQDGDGALSEEELEEITFINVSAMGVSSVQGIELFEYLDTLYCSNNNMTSLGVDGHSALTVLLCANNRLTSLDVSGFPNLEYLDCRNNRLTSLQVNNNPLLEELNCSNNRLTSLSVDKAEALTYLYCDNNRLTSLYLDENDQLMTVSVLDNKRSVEAENGKFDLATLPGFEMIRAQDFVGCDLNGTVLTVKKSGEVVYSYACGAGVSALFSLDVVVTENKPASGIPIDDDHFPDGFFRAYVYNNLDKDHDGYLSDAERSAVTMIDVSQDRVASLEGVALFPNLEKLLSHGNLLESLDVSELPKLTMLKCNNNRLTRLDLSHNAALTHLDCSGNKLTSLNLHANPKLEHLDCGHNALNTLDLSGNPALKEVWCLACGLTTLDLSHNPELNYLQCGNNFFTTLDLSHNLKLTYLQCVDCRLAALDLSANKALVTLVASQRHTLSIDAINNQFDLSTLPGFDVKKASNWEVGTVSGNILTVPDSCRVTYVYDCGNGLSMTVTLQVHNNIREWTPGDVNNDGKVDGRDLLRLARFLAGDGVSVQASDVNGDGKTDGRDLLRLARFLAGDHVELK